MSYLPTRDQIKIGMNVLVELKQDKGTGKLTKGVVKEILTSGNYHPYGIMVNLSDTQRGRVKQISENNVKFDNENNLNRFDTSIPKEEDPWNEFKSTFQYDLKEEIFRNEGKIEAADARKNDQKRIRDDIQKEISITVSAFANQEGGRLFVGVSDDSSVLGLERDLKYYNQSKDKFKLAITDSLKKFLKNNAFLAKLKFEFVNTDNKEYFIILVPKSTDAVYLHFLNIQETYVRMQNRSQKFNTEEFLKHCKDRF